MSNMPDYLSKEFIESLMQNHFPQSVIRLHGVASLDIDSSASILVTLTAGRSETRIGHFGLQVSFEKDGKDLVQNMVMKIKPHGEEITEMLSSLAEACGEPLSAIYPYYKQKTGFYFTHVREQEIYRHAPSGLQPQIFGLYTDFETNTFLILMEYLQEVDLLNSVMAPEKWTDKHIKAALEQMAQWHASKLDAELPLNYSFWTDKPSGKYMSDLAPLWEALLKNASARFPALYTPERTTKLQEFIADLPHYWQELENHPKTLIHNDFNPRNTCFKDTPQGLNLCVYDWELATFHLPQYDVVELLCFVLDENRYDLREDYLEFYRRALNSHTNTFDDQDRFKRGFYLAARDFGLHRLGMYMMAHSVGPYPFLERVVNSYFDLISNENI